MWLAPNVVTLSGFLVNLIPSILIIVLYGWDLSGPLDNWFCFLLGSCYGFYMWMDNCDGKQARRTGNSSPLGMIFDHQCDVIVSVINSFVIQRMMLTGNTRNSLHCLFVTSCPFYYVLLEQYYTGEMNFPPINGVDEGTLLYVTLCMFTAYYGSEEYWLAKTELFGETMTRSDMWVTLLKVFPLFSFVALTNIYLKKHYPHLKKLWDTKYFVA